MNEVLPILRELHFIRPEWFYAFVPLALFIVFALRHKRTSRSWQSACDPALLPHILSDVMLKQSYWPLLLAALAYSVGIIAMAGPVYQKLPQPVFRETSSLVIALDLSQSMNATDVNPSRLDRAKLKLLDLLKMRGAGQTALVVYAAGAFTVTPLTDDTATIANMVPTLETDLMPAQGSDVDKAIAKAVQLLHQAGVEKGDILLMTDGLRSSDLDAIKALPKDGIRLSILGFGTPQGGPIPREGGFLHDSSGAIVIPKLEPGLLRSAAKLGGGIYLNMQADRSDTRRLSALFNSRHAQHNAVATKLTADIWREEGPWLLLLVIPLAALGARRGWLASLLCMLFVMQMMPQPVYAAGLLDKLGLNKLKLDSDFLWQRPDQKAAEALKNGDAKTAAKLFQQPDWKAAAQYRAGDFAAAAKDLAASKQSDALYNRGNALAQLKKYQEAVDAYDQSLKLNPDNADAKYNRDEVQKVIKQQQQQSDKPNSDKQKKDQKQSDKQNSDQNKKQENQKQSDKNNDQQQQSSSDQQKSDQNKQNQQNQQQSGENKNEQQKQQDQNQNQDQKQDQKQDQSRQQSDQQNNKKSQSEQKQKAPETEKEKNNLRAEQDKDHQQKPEQQKTQEQKVAGDKENAKAKEDDEAAEQWLRRIPDDPGGLLRRKFLYQYSRLPNQVEDEHPW